MTGPIFIKRVSKNVIKRAYGELNNIFFRTSLIKFYLKSQRMSDSFYHITKFSELYLKKK